MLKGYLYHNITQVDNIGDESYFVEMAEAYCLDFLALGYISECFLLHFFSTQILYMT